MAEQKKKPLRILLVEDNETDAKITKRVFQKSGIFYQLYVVDDGQKAVDFMYHEGSYQDQNEYPKPDLIFLDLNLPKMNGFEVLKKVKSDKRFSMTPVVMLTGSKEDQDSFQSLTDGATSFIEKPVTHDQFQGVIKGLAAYLSSGHLKLS